MSGTGRTCGLARQRSQRAFASLLLAGAIACSNGTKGPYGDLHSLIASEVPTIPPTGTPMMPMPMPGPYSSALTLESGTGTTTEILLPTATFPPGTNPHVKVELFGGDQIDGARLANGTAVRITVQTISPPFQPPILLRQTVPSGANAPVVYHAASPWRPVGLAQPVTGPGGAQFWEMQVTESGGWALVEPGDSPADGGGGGQDGPGASPGQLRITPVSKDFGNEAVRAALPTPPVAFMVSNPGDQAVANFTVTLSGSDFRLAGVNTCAVTSLGPRSSCLIGVQFLPQARGVRSGSLTATGNGTQVTAPLSGRGVESELSISPIHADFSAALGTQSAAASFRVTNVGEGLTRTAPSITLIGANPDQFVVASTTCRAPLDAGASCTIGVTFNPTLQAPATAILNVDVQTPLGPVSATLSGTVGAPTMLSLNPASENYGCQRVGDTLVLAFTVANPADAPATGPIAPKLAGDTSSFTITTTTCTTPLAPGANCRISVAFQPTTIGAKSATLMVSAQPGGTASATLSGLAVTGKEITISPQGSLEVTVVGKTSPAVNYSISNTGGIPTGPLKVSLEGSAASSYVITSNSCMDANLSAGASCSVALAFKPMQPGLLFVTLKVASTCNGANLGLAATGLPVLDIGPRTSPQDTSVGATSPAVVYSIINHGDTPLAAVKVTLSGTQSADYLITGNGCVGPLAAGKSCEIQLVFKPGVGGSGARDASLDVTSGPLAASLPLTSRVP
jgi:hypothetical protein